MKVVIYFLILLSLLTNCANRSTEDSTMYSNLEEDLKIIQKQRIYFGHHSVGRNIIEGLKDLSSNSKNIGLNIISLNDSTQLPEYFFLESSVGKNRHPDIKCDDFSSSIERYFSNKLDLAFFKFCYVDIKKDTDINNVFQYYKKTMDRLKNSYPDITFIHFTVPLKARSKGIFSKIKRWWSNEDLTDQDNIKRNEFNNLIRNNYKNEPIFDLAKIESTFSNGKRESFINNGHVYYSLISKYTDDGGHLNEYGRKIVAAELVKMLAEIVREKNN